MRKLTTLVNALILSLAAAGVSRADNALTLYVGGTTTYFQMVPQSSMTVSWSLLMPLTPGTTGQALTVVSSTNNVTVTSWTTVSGGGTAIWGNITGVLSTQTDLQTLLVGIGVSTNSLGGQIATLSVSTASLQSQIVSVGASTQTLANAVGASTATLALNFPINLASNTSGILAPSHLVSTVAYTTVDNNWTAPQTLGSSLTVKASMVTGTQQSTHTVIGNLALQGGFYLSTGTTNGTGGVVSSNYTTGPTDSVIYASAPLGGLTITLGPSTNQDLVVKKVDGSTQTVTVRTTGTDLIGGTTQQFVLYSIGAQGEVMSGPGGWWEHGHGIDVVPPSISTFFGGQQVQIGVASSVYTCPVEVKIPESIMGFRFFAQAALATRQVTLSFYDFRGNVMFSTGPVNVSVGLNFVSLGQSFVNVPKGYYSVGIQGNQTDISLNASAGVVSNPFCEVTASSLMTAPATITQVGGSSTARNFSISLVVSGGRTSE